MPSRVPTYQPRSNRFLSQIYRPSVEPASSLISSDGQTSVLLAVPRMTPGAVRPATANASRFFCFNTRGLRRRGVRMSTFLDCHGLTLIGQKYAMDRLASHHKPTFLGRESDGAAEHLLVFYLNDLGELGDGRP